MEFARKPRLHDFGDQRCEAMSVEEEMSKHGFRLSASCSGKAAYTKFVKHQGKRAYISVTNVDGDGFPTTLDDPVRVIIYDMRSGDEVEPGQDFSSVGTYLESIGE